jgi:hypothetical protein
MNIRRVASPRTSVISRSTLQNLKVVKRKNEHIEKFRRLEIMAKNNKWAHFKEERI